MRRAPAPKAPVEVSITIPRRGHGEVAEEASKLDDRKQVLQIRGRPAIKSEIIAFLNSNASTARGWSRGDEGNERAFFVSIYQSKLACYDIQKRLQSMHNVMARKKTYLRGKPSE